jgi:hypothetical protein
VTKDDAGMQTLAKTAADQVEEQHAKDEALLPKPLPDPDKLKAQELGQFLVQVAVADHSMLILIIARCPHNDKRMPEWCRWGNESSAHKLPPC